MARYTSLLLAVFLLLLGPPGSVRALDQPGKGPARTTVAAKEAPAGWSNPGAAVVRLFRDHISAVDGNRCPSYPSCSSYSVQAFEKHGFIVGWLMTVDRLIHEGSEEEEVSGTVKMGDRLKINDPVHNNDFWWYASDGKDTP